jgi:ATPase family AAA domain-containing protein 1
MHLGFRLTLNRFMTLWDGLTSANSAGVPSRIVVLGATNRINDIDEAILRRMPKKFPVPLPGKEQRLRILQLILRDTRTDPEHFDMNYVAKIMAGMSGSDIKEACRDAAMMPMREYIRQHRASGGTMASIEPARVRGIRTTDFFGRRNGQVHPGVSKRTATDKTKSLQPASDENEDADEELVADSQD